MRILRTMEMGLGWNLGNQLDAYEEDPDAKEAVDVLINGWFNNDPSYTLESVYNSAPVF